MGIRILIKFLVRDYVKITEGYLDNIDIWKNRQVFGTIFQVCGEIK